MDLDAIFRPQGIAILGASPNSSATTQILGGLKGLGYSGSIHPVNPKYSEFAGLECVPTAADLPEGVTTAAIVVGAKGSVSLMDDAGAAGIKGAAIFAVGFNEAGPEGLELENQLKATASRYDMAVVGPNCMGALAPAYHSSLYSGSLANPDTLVGRTGLISQSGSVAIALLGMAERVGGWSLVVSSGNETATTAADYLSYMAEDDETDRIALFVESVRDPAKFEKAARRAAENGKPVIALKVGRSEGAKQNVKAHTGALAGSDRVASAFFRRSGVLEVLSFGELVETIVALRHPVAPRGRRLGAIHPSGGEASLLLDAAEPLGLKFPPLAPEGRERLTRDLHPWFASAGNPLDAWGPILYSDAYRTGLDVLAEQGDIDVLLMLQDVAGDGNRGPSEVSLTIVELGRATQERHAKPVVVLSNPHADIHPGVAEALEGAGIPGLIGTDAGLRAIKHWFDFYDAQRRDGEPASAADSLVTPEAIPAPGGALNEHDSKGLFARAGIAGPREALASSADEAVEAAGRIGYPVVIKVVGQGLEHKTERKLVHLNVRTPEAARTSSAELQAAVTADEFEGFLVAEQVVGGREMLLGILRDPVYGHVVVVGGGGVFAEALDDVALGIPPLSVEDAEEMVEQLKFAKTLGAWRGQDPADLPALYEAISRMGDLALCLGERLESAEINPLAVMPMGKGVRALDALVVLNG